MLSNLKAKKSRGPDRTPNVFLRRFAEITPTFLATITFCVSFSLGVLPDDRLTARDVPVLKKVDSLSPSNYPPTSLTCTSCKFLEHKIGNVISQHLCENNLLTQFQHGFRKDFPTTTWLLTTFHEFAYVLDKTVQVDVILPRNYQGSRQFRTRVPIKNLSNLSNRFVHTY
uniref:Putative outcast ele5 orf2-h 1e-60-j 4 n=1 Tax=Ixodes ricinus TaxID=34613 RepID=A0A0K8R973_IXORI